MKGHQTHIQWADITEIPHRNSYGYNPLEEKFHPPARRMHGYDSLIRDFDRRLDKAEAIFSRDRFAPTTIRSALESARRRAGLTGVRIVTRGDRVFAVHTDTEARREYREGIENAIHTFAVSPARSVALTLPGGADALAVYHALHYKRTAMGYGDISIRMDRAGTITLHKDIA